MTSFWLCCVIVSFCYGTAQLQIVLAGKEELGPKALGNWYDLAGSQGSVDTWDYRDNKLATAIRAGGRPSVSWFLTPALVNTPNTSYLDIEASCTNNPFQLEIYGTSDSSLKNFESIQNVTFEKRSLNTATIKKSYSYLRILVRATSQTTFYIHSIKMYHYFCEKTRIHNTVLSQVDSSPANIGVIVQCGDNAVTSDGNSTNITANCTPKGNWTVGDQKCVCVKGFESNNQECSLGETADDSTGCLKGHYKSKISNEGCTSCPARSTSSSTNTACNCLEGKYRLKNETGVSSAPCYGFPSKVRNIKVEKSDSRGNITLSWEPPLEQGGLPRSLKYDVGCGDECELKFTPSKVNLTKTTVEISGLTPGHEYNFTVFSKNIISVLYSNGHLAFENKKFKLPRDPVKENTNNSSGIINIIIATTVAGVFLSIIIIAVLLVKYIRLKRASNLSTPFDTSLEAVDTPQNSLPIDQEESGYETISRVVRRFYDDVDTNANNCKDAELYEEVGVPSDTRRTSGYKTYEEPKMAQENPGYTELDKNTLHNRNATDDSTYQKLQRQDSDYVIPAHERRESYEDIKIGRNLPGYEELDQSKREADDYTPLTKSGQKPELA